MALNTHLGFLFKATDQASGVMRRISLGLGQLTHGSKLAAQAMAGVSLSFAGNSLMNFAESGAKSLLVAAEASGRFTKELTAARSVIEGATLSDMDKLGSTAKALGSKYGIAAQEVAAGITEMGRAGLSVPSILETIEPALLFATSGQLSFADASKVLISTMNAFKIPFDQAGVTVDKFANILNTTQASGEDIKSTFAKAAGMAGAYDQSLDETLVMLGVMKQLGIDASSASTNIRQAISRIYSMPSVINKITAMKVALYDDMGKRRPWHEVAFDMEDTMSKMDKTKAAIEEYSIFGARGILENIAAVKGTVEVVRDGNKVLLHGSEAFEAMLEGQKKRGTAQRLATNLMDTYEGQKDRLVAILKNLRIDLGRGFEEAFAPVVRVLNGLLESVSEFMASIGPEGRRFIAILAIMEIGIIGATGAMMALLGSLMLLKLALPIIAPMLVPILAITLSVLGVIAGLVITYKALQGETSKTGTFLEQLATSFGKVKLFAQGLFQLLTTGRISGSPMTELLKKENTGVLESLGTMWQHITRARAAFAGFMEGIRSHLDNPAVKLALESLKNAFSSLTENLGLGENGLDKLTSTTGEAHAIGMSWGKWLVWVTLTVITLTDAFVRLVDLLMDIKGLFSIIPGEFISAVFMINASIMALVIGLASLGWVGGKLKGLLGLGRGAASVAAASSAGVAGEAAGGAAAGAAPGFLRRFFGAANNLRKAGGTQVLSASGEILASQAPNIGRQLLNLTGITHLGKLTTSILGRFQLTSGLAQKLAGSAGAMTKGTLGFVAAAGAAGYALGTLIDNSFGLSDKISKWFYDEPEALKMKDNGAYLKTVATRGAPAFFDAAQAKAENAVAGAGPGKGQVSLSPETLRAFKEVAGERGNIVMQMDSEVVGRLIEKRARNNQANSFDAEDDN